MKRIIVLATALIVSTSATAQDVQRTIQTECAKEWPTDFDMRVYCQDKQRAAVKTLERGRPADIPEKEFTIVRAACAKEWPTDFDMRAYCEGKQFRAIRQLLKSGGGL